MRFGIAFFVAFGVALVVTNNFRPFSPAQASPVEQFGNCFDQPQGSEARAKCISEHLENLDKYTGSAMTELGAGILASFDLDNGRRR